VGLDSNLLDDFPFPSGRRREAILNANLKEHPEGRGLAESAEHIITRRELRAENQARKERGLEPISEKDYLIAKHFGDSKDKVVLELGTSTGGVFAREAAPYVAHIDGISAGITEEEIGRIERECQNCDIRLADAASLPYEDNRFDYIYGIYVHRYFAENEPSEIARAYYIKVLSEIYRTLKPGGMAVLSPAFSGTFRWTDTEKKEDGQLLDSVDFTETERSLLPNGIKVVLEKEQHSFVTRLGLARLDSIRIYKPARLGENP
jgi:ubiquinone/menaquinone biosynthesis C-methylase UbiE